MTTTHKRIRKGTRVVCCRPVGRPAKLMYPLACRLEAQNPDKVEG